MAIEDTAGCARLPDRSRTSPQGDRCAGDAAAPHRMRPAL